MSDQQETGVITSLEEVFLSREFGRAPSRGISSIGIAEEPAEPPQLEQLFLSEAFGHPEALTAPTPAVVAAPVLIALPGRGGSDRDNTRYRAIAAVSGVAAAVVVVAGLVAGSGPSTKAPSQTAQGKGHGTQPTGPNGGQPTPGSPPPSGQTTSPTNTGTSTGATNLAELASEVSPSAASGVAPGTSVVVIPSPSTSSTGTPGSGPTPPAPAPGGGGNILTPVLALVGNTVSTLGTTVTEASNGLGQALPVASPVTGLLSNLGGVVTSLGQSVTVAGPAAT